MDVTSIATYAMYSKQAQTQQELQVAMMKQSNEASKAALKLVSQAAGNSSVNVPSSASSGLGSIIDITV